MTRDQYGKAYEAGISQTIRYLIPRGVNRCDAEDVAQQAWLRGWERLSQLRDDARLLEWVQTIGRNTLRSARRRNRLCQLSENEEPFAERVDRDSVIDAERVLSECSQTDRQLLMDYYIFGRCGKEIAHERGLTTDAIHCALLRARRRVAMRLGLSDNRKRRCKASSE